MISFQRLAPRLSRVWLLCLALPLALLILSGCGNSIAAGTTGDPAGTVVGSKGDIVAQVDGAPVWVDASGKATSDVTKAQKDKDGNPVT